LAAAALEALQAHVKEVRMVNSDYGNPYECHFGKKFTSKITKVEKDDTDAVEITTRGWATRRSRASL